MEAKGSVLPIMSKRSGKRNCFGVMPTNSAYWARATAFSGVRVTLVFIFWEIKAKLGQVAVQNSAIFRRKILRKSFKVLDLHPAGLEPATL
jgi:hypothetical protein